MSTIRSCTIHSLLDPRKSGGLVLLAALCFTLAASSVARAAEIIPSVGITRAMNGDDESRASYGLALRGNVAPFLQAELGASYRKDPFGAGAVQVVQWPVTASLWVRPLAAIYAGGGVGWYQTTLEYANDAIPNSTSRKFGAHLGGGFDVPLVPSVLSLDLNGRYVYLGDQASELPPRNFKADYWTTTAGLAIHF